jgi:signal transduction histidine kinase
MDSTAVEAGQSRDRKVLVVEDDIGAREAIVELVADQGLEVLVASNGEEALDVLRRERVDVILLDLWLPVMDGWQFRALQRADATLSDVPVIAMSADRSPQAEAIHADFFVRKPFEASQLVLAIERLLLVQERQRLAEKLKETERVSTLGAIAASIAHEVNNPLTYVLGNVFLMQNGLTAARLRSHPLLEQELLDNMAEMLGDVRVGAERIHAVTATLQNLSGSRSLGLSWLDVRSVVDTSLAIVGNEIRHRARVTRDFGDVPLILGNEARLGQVFVNLLANAAHAIPPGRYGSNEIRVVVGTSGDDIVVEVHDTGGGIPPELQGRIFEPFFTTRKGEGTGIGLTLSRSIVEEHGGRIELQSTSARGSTFRVVLPVLDQATEDDVVEPPTLIEHRTAAAPARGRILIIDDDPILLDSMRRMLEEQHQVIATISARDALARLDLDRAWDVVVCDMMMPEMTGGQFHAELVRRHPDLVSRVIFMTAGGLMPDVRAFRAETGGIWLDKPFHPQALQKAVADVMASQSSRHDRH